MTVKIGMLRGAEKRRLATEAQRHRAGWMDRILREAPPTAGDYVRAGPKGVCKGAVPADVPAWLGVSLGPKEGSGETSRGVNGLRCDDHGPF